MTPRFLNRRKSHNSNDAPTRKPKFFRPSIESLEERLAPSAGLPPDIIVGRTQSAYSVGDINNHSLTITYTVYNEQAEDVSGILLTTTLEPGVVFTSATQLPDSNGSNLAWSLGTLSAFSRVSVSVTVTLPNTFPLAIDTGAHAFGTLNAGMVTSDTPAVTLTSRTFPAEHLATTPDANTTDPYVQEEAAKLRYDPQSIFNYLNTDIGYESYAGSLRGARGTLWSNAGNSLDEASLGVALFRASGIPARYAHSTLSDPLAKQMILSMFPASFQTVGYIPAGSTVSDPANDHQLLAQSRDHYWLQVDTGNGFQDADTSGLGGTTIGTAYTTVTSTFTEVADSLRQKVEVKLDAETYSQASAAFGLGGNALSTSTVIDQTFNSVDLVGRPLTVGNFVSQSALGAIISVQTNTYSPYIRIGDDASPDLLKDKIIQGTPYQEVLTNFPFGTQILTGLFLELNEVSVDGVVTSYKRTLADRFGAASRQSGALSGSITSQPGDIPIISPLDLTTVNISEGNIPASIISSYQVALKNLKNDLSSFQTKVGQTNDALTNDSLASQATALFQNILMILERTRLSAYLHESDFYNHLLAPRTGVLAYVSSPRISLIQSSATVSSDNTLTLSLDADLLKDNIYSVAFPGQNLAAIIAFQVQRGFLDTGFESAIFATDNSSGQASPINISVSTQTVFSIAQQQGIPLLVIQPNNSMALDALPFSGNAKAYIAAALAQGETVIVPVNTVIINGQQRVGWYQINQSTGATIGVMDNGSHDTNEEIALLKLQQILTNTAAFGFGVLAGLTVSQVGTFIKEFLITSVLNTIGGEKAKAIAEIGFVIKSLTEAIEAYSKSDPTLAFFYLGLITGLGIGKANLLKDPPVLNILFNPLGSTIPDNNFESANLSVNAKQTGGIVSANVSPSSALVSGMLTANWSTTNNSAFQTATLTSPSSSITDVNGNPLGSGSIALSSTAQATVSGPASYAVTGTGSLTFYGPSEPSLGVAGNWDSYTATVTGSPVITVTVPDGALTLNGTALPAGTYTIRTSSAVLTGSGATSSPNFAGSVSLNVTNGTIGIGSGSGTVTVGGGLLDFSNGGTLTNYNGTLNVTTSGSGNNLDNVVINGSATNVLYVSTNQTTLNADQNTPAVFQIAVNTSFADKYTLNAEAPAGWTVTVDANGNVTVKPAPGTQNGTYPIRIVATSTTIGELVAQTTINVTVTPTQPDLNLNVNPDAIFTVPFDGAQVPSAFQATLQNLGPATDTYTVTSANLPSGFSLLSSGTQLTVPAGLTGILGLYLQPNAGSTLPAPGTVLTFDITATSTTDPTITKTQTVTFTMPEVHAVTLTAGPNAVSTTPGTTVASTLTIRSVGNVSETISLDSVVSSSLTVTGLPASINLTLGQTVTIPLILTSSAATPLNSNLTATFNATFGPTATAQTLSFLLPIRVAVPGADAIATSSNAAAELGNTDLANRLNDLSASLTNLVQTPSSDVYRSQSISALQAVIGLVGTDPYLASLVPGLTSDNQLIEQSTSADQIQAAVVQLGHTLGDLGQILADEAAHRFTISFANNTSVAQPQTPSPFQILLRNNGTQTTTYDLTAINVPAGVTAQLSQNTITLDPGQSTFTTGNPDLTVTLTPNSTTELTPFGFAIQATAHNATAITQSISGSLTVRSEIVSVVSVSPTPAFTDPGGSVAVSAQLLNAVNREQTAKVQYTVTNAAGVVVFTSATVNVALTIVTNITSVSLGTLNTTGFAKGDYTITVTVSDDKGAPIPGASGSGHLLIGSPITASLTTSPTSLLPGSGTVTTTLQVNSQSTTASPLLTPVGTLAIPGAAGVKVFGNRAYVVGSDGIHVIDISDPTNPKDVATFGQSDIVSGLGVTGIMLDGDKLVITTGVFAANTNEQVLVYSLANPSAPTLLGQGPLTFNGVNYTGLSSASIVNHHVYTSSLFFRYFISGQSVFGQYGESLVIDVSNPATPGPVDVIFNRPPEPNFTYPDGLRWPDGSSNIWQIAEVNTNTAYIGTTANTKSVVKDIGQILVVDASNPNVPNVVRTLNIPGMSVVTGIQVVGNTAWVIGSSLGWRSGVTPLGLNGKIVIAQLDVSDALNPTIVSTKIFNEESLGLHFLQNAGNGLFVSSSFSVSGPDNLPRISVFNTNDPLNVTLTQVAIPRGTNAIEAANNELFTGDGTNLIIYQVGQGQQTPATASITVPTSEGVSVIAGSFSVPPTRTIPGANGTSYQWDLNFDSTTTSTSITWQENVTGLQPGRSRIVDSNGSVSFVSQGTSGQIALADQSVTGAQIIGLTPAKQSIAPGASTSFTVQLSNPTTVPVTYTLTALGVPANWINLAPTVTIPANGQANIPLTIKTDSFAGPTDYGVTVMATAGDVSSSVQGTLTVTGTPIAPDAFSHGVVVSLTPNTASAGQGTSARYVLRVTNTGNAVESYNLAATLPTGLVGVFATTGVTVSPGVGNFREVVLTLTPSQGTQLGSNPFTVSATSTTSNAIGSATGTLTVVNQGVTVTFDKSTGTPGDTFQATVTNTGSTEDTFDLSLAGPAAIVSELGSSRVTLGPGQSQAVPVITTAVNFAVQGALPFTIAAHSTGNSAVVGSTTASLSISGTVGLTAAFERNNQVIPIPGTSDFLLSINNTGNTEDAYTATITLTTGLVTASLIGLDGNPTQSIPIIRIPGLASGLIVVRANLPINGIGTVSVKIQSLNHPDLVSSNVATLSTSQPAPILVGGANDGTAIAYYPTIGQFGSGTSLTFFPGFAGNVRTATADVNGDGVPDFIGGSGPGMTAEVAIIDGATHQVIARFQPFESTYRLGVFVTSADLNGDGKADVVVTPDLGGGPVVAIYDGAKLSQGLADGEAFGQPAQIVRFYGIEGDPNFRGGVRPAVGDMNGDQTPDLMISAGFLGGPRIALFDGRDLAAGNETPHHLIPDFFAFEPTLRNGAFVALGDINGDGKTELAFGGGSTSANRVRIFDATQLLVASVFTNLDNAPASAQLDNFYSGDPSLHGGVRIAVRPIDNSGKAALITASGDNQASKVQVYTSKTLLNNSAPSTPDQVIDPFGSLLANGVYVG